MFIMSEDSATQAREDDTDLSGQWKKMHIEPTLPIRLKVTYGT